MPDITVTNNQIEVTVSPALYPVTVETEAAIVQPQIRTTAVELKPQTSQVTIKPEVVEWVTVAEQGPAGRPGRDGTGTGGQSYEMVFTQASLSIANLLPVIHEFGNYPSALSITDDAGNDVRPDGWRNVSVNAIAVNLESFVPISGQWKFSLTE